MIIKEKPRYRTMCRLDLAEELTGVSRKTIQKRASRRDWTLAETILAYLKVK